MAERLREVAELAPQARVVLLGEQADVVAEREPSKAAALQRGLVQLRVL